MATDTSVSLEPHRPRRGDGVEAWLKRHLEARLAAGGRGSAELSTLLEEYRHRADSDTTLDSPCAAYDPLP